MLVLHSEVYSNTGRQLSKSTPRARCQVRRRRKREREDLALMAMTYGTVYGGRGPWRSDARPLRLSRGRGPPRPSLIIAYSHCIAHGYICANGIDQQKPRSNPVTGPALSLRPTAAKDGQRRSSLDSKAPSLPLKTYAYNDDSLHHARPQQSRGGAPSA